MFLYRLEKSFVISVSGKDSSRYLNARLTNDVKSLAINKYIAAAQLSPQGGTEGIFTVIKFSDQDYLLYGEANDSNQVLSAFRRYIVADRVELKDLTNEYDLFHVDMECLTKLSLLSKQDLVVRTENALIIPQERAGFPGYDVLTTKLSPIKSIYEITNQLESEYELIRIKAGKLRYGKDIDEDTLFPEIGFFSSISRNKGCYTGQEVVERVEAIGKLPSRFALLSYTGDAVLQGETIIASDAKKVGEILSTAFDLQNNISFAIARLKNRELQDLKSESVQIKFLRWIEF